MKRNMNMNSFMNSNNKEAQENIEKYASKSNDELMGELNTLKQSGTINNSELMKMANTVSPMLSEAQRQKLKDIIQKLMD